LGSNKKMLDIYNDGHQRPDVLSALNTYIAEMLDLQESTHMYTGEHMNTVVRGARLLADSTIKQRIISYHDECCANASDAVTRRWMMAGKGGKMKDKSRGPARMVAGFVCAEIGMWPGSLQFMNPGKNNDGWWNGEDTQRQAAVHLLEFDVRFLGCIYVDVFDNSSEHNCMAEDALLVDKLNKDAAQVRKNKLQDWQTDRDNEAKLLGFLSLPLPVNIGEAARGMTCLCASCMLAAQSDFKSQRSGVEEVYMKHNALYGTGHCCKFLPKFHLELNPIEKIWGRMKWYLRKYNTGKLQDLAQNMDVGLSPYNVDIAMIKRFVRLATAYYIAYREGKDVMQAEQWLKKHRSHRGHSAKMDAKLEALYFPLGRTHQDAAPATGPAEFQLPAAADDEEEEDIVGDDEIDWDAALESLGEISIDQVCATII
jgi:transposase